LVSGLEWIIRDDFTDSAMLLASLTRRGQANLQRNKRDARDDMVRVWGYHCEDARGKCSEECKDARNNKGDDGGTTVGLVSLL